MNIVIIRSNPVNPDSRVEKEAYSLVKNGYKVTILCWDRDTNHEPREETITVSDINIPIIRLGYKAEFGQGFKSLFPFIKFQFAMVNWLKKNHKKYDVIHACDFDTAFFSCRIAKKYKKKFIFDIFDFIGGDESNYLQRLEKKLQFRIINMADATIICTEERIGQIEGSNPKKVVVIHNSPSPVQMNELNTIHKKTNRDFIKVVYVGILQDFRLLKELGNYFKNNNQIELHIGGFGKYDSYFSELGNAYENIYYYGRLKYEDTLNLENECDIMLAIYDPKLENHRYAAPNKFYEALMLGKPLIMVKETGMSNVVFENKIGELIDYSEEDFAKGIDRLIKRKEDWNQISKKMKEIYSNSYSWEQMEKRLVTLYKNL